MHTSEGMLVFAKMPDTAIRKARYNLCSWTASFVCARSLKIFVPPCVLQVHLWLWHRVPWALVHLAMSLTEWANSLQTQRQ